MLDKYIIIIVYCLLFVLSTAPKLDAVILFFLMIDHIGLFLWPLVASAVFLMTSSDKIRARLNHTIGISEWTNSALVKRSSMMGAGGPGSHGSGWRIYSIAVYIQTCYCFSSTYMNMYLNIYESFVIVKHLEVSTISLHLSTGTCSKHHGIFYIFQNFSDHIH